MSYQEMSPSDETGASSSEPPSPAVAHALTRDEAVRHWATLARRGDSAAFEQLWKIVEKMVRGKVVLQGVGKKDADDVAQQVCLKLWTKPGREDSDGSLIAWVRTVAKNAAHDWVRAETRRPNIGVLKPVKLLDELLRLVVQKSIPTHFALCFALRRVLRLRTTDIEVRFSEFSLLQIAEQIQVMASERRLVLTQIDRVLELLRRQTGNVLLRDFYKRDEPRIGAIHDWIQSAGKAARQAIRFSLQSTELLAELFQLVAQGSFPAHFALCLALHRVLDFPVEEIERRFSDSPLQQMAEQIRDIAHERKVSLEHVDRVLDLLQGQTKTLSDHYEPNEQGVNSIRRWIKSAEKMALQTPGLHWHMDSSEPAEPSSEEAGIGPSSDFYAELLRTLFNSGIPPHEAIVFCFNKLLPSPYKGGNGRYMPADIISMCKESLHNLAIRLKEEYEKDSRLPPDELERLFQPLLDAVAEGTALGKKKLEDYIDHCNRKSIPWLVDSVKDKIFTSILSQEGEFLSIVGNGKNLPHETIVYGHSRLLRKRLAELKGSRAMSVLSELERNLEAGLNEISELGDKRIAASFAPLQRQMGQSLRTLLAGQDIPVHLRTIAAFQTGDTRLKQYFSESPDRDLSRWRDRVHQRVYDHLRRKGGIAFMYACGYLPKKRQKAVRATKHSA